VRTGYYYDPAPGPDETANILLPSFTYNVFTLGSTYQFGQLGLDFSFEYLAGTDRDVEPSSLGNMPGSHGMDIIIFSLGATYSFSE
jgi:long-chain fatty acid transport protein